MLVSCAADSNKAMRHAEDEKKADAKSIGKFICRYIVLTIIRIRIEPSLFII